MYISSYWYFSRLLFFVLCHPIGTLHPPGPRVVSSKVIWGRQARHCHESTPLELISGRYRCLLASGGCGPQRALKKAALATPPHPSTLSSSSSAYSASMDLDNSSLNRFGITKISTRSYRVIIKHIDLTWWLRRVRKTRVLRCRSLIRCWSLIGSCIMTPILIKVTKCKDGPTPPKFVLSVSSTKEANLAFICRCIKTLILIIIVRHTILRLFRSGNFGRLISIIGRLTL